MEGERLVAREEIRQLKGSMGLCGGNRATVHRVPGPQVRAYFTYWTLPIISYVNVKYYYIFLFRKIKKTTWPSTNTRLFLGLSAQSPTVKVRRSLPFIRTEVITFMKKKKIISRLSMSIRFIYIKCKRYYPNYQWYFYRTVYSTFVMKDQV